MSTPLSYKELIAMRDTISNNLMNDFIHIGLFNLEKYKSTIAYYVPTSNLEYAFYYSREKYTLGTNMWFSTPYIASVTSMGTRQELKNSTTFYIDTLKIIMPIATYPTELLAPSQANVYVDAISGYIIQEQGIWVAYNNNIYRVIGVTKPDSINLTYTLDCKLDSFSGDLDLGTSGTYLEGYLYAGSLLKAKYTTPSPVVGLRTEDYKILVNEDREIII